MGRRSPKPPRFPSFFKVLIGQNFSNQMKIPPAFVKHFNGDVPKECFLCSPAKKKWLVDIRENEKKLFFQKGWRTFVQENSLQVHDFLLFKYAGDSHFDVAMYGINCCEKEVVAPTTEIAKAYQSKQLIRKESTKKMTLRSSSSRIVGETQEDKALKAAIKHISCSKYPNFISVMRKAYAEHRYLHLPSSFLMKHLKVETENVKLQISDELWAVKAATYRRNSVRLSRGWSGFSRKNALQVGDVCVFELIDSKNSVLKVSIFRH